MCWIILHVLLLTLDVFFSTIYFFKKIKGYNLAVSNISLDPDQARLFVGPDQGPNFLQRLSADLL